MTRVVLDTHVVLSALLFPSGRLIWLRTAWQAGAFLPLVSQATAAELLRALAYPKFRLAGEDIETLVAEYLPFVEVVQVSRRRRWAGLKDLDDGVFLDLAAAGGAEFLVTGDRGLAKVKPPKGCRVVTPGEFRVAVEG